MPNPEGIGGRPTLMTVENTRRICEALAMGSSYELACNYAGVHYPTYRAWMRKADDRREAGADDLDPFIKFQNDVKKAIGDRTLGWLKIIQEAAENGQWTAAAWKLERCEREHFSKDSSEIKEIKFIFEKLLEKRGEQ